MKAMKAKTVIRGVSLDVDSLNVIDAAADLVRLSRSEFVERASVKEARATIAREAEAVTPGSAS